MGTTTSVPAAFLSIMSTMSGWFSITCWSVCIWTSPRIFDQGLFSPNWIEMFQSSLAATWLLGKETLHLEQSITHYPQHHPKTHRRARSQRDSPEPERDLRQEPFTTSWWSWLLCLEPERTFQRTTLVRNLLIVLPAGSFIRNRTVNQREAGWSCSCVRLWSICQPSVSCWRNLRRCCWFLSASDAAC